MTVHQIRPPKNPKPPKIPRVDVDSSDGGLTITIAPVLATVTPFPKKSS
jgi:hypothetical protein